MAYHNTIFRQMLQLISRLDFQNIVKIYKGDYRVRTLRCWDQFIFLLLGQCSRRDSLRETVFSINSMQSKLYHLGTRQVKKSTLSDANTNRPYQIYQDLFFQLLQKTQKIAPRHRLKLNRKLYFLDATTIDLCLKLFPWARFRKTKGAIRLHTLLQADGTLPVFMTITDGKTHEARVAPSVPLPKNSYLAIDRGYHDFRQYNYYINNNIRCVTRMKTNAKYKVVNTLNTTAPTILKDEYIEFTGYATHQKCPHTLRKISYYDSSKDKIILFLTNDLKNDAQTIADIYKARWDIELFFKTIKQNLKIKRFFGTTSNAVFTQVWIAMIAYLLISFLKFKHKVQQSVQTLFRLIQLNIFERKDLRDLILNKIFEPPGEPDTSQLTLFNF